MNKESMKKNTISHFNNRVISQKPLVLGLQYFAEPPVETPPVEAPNDPEKPATDKGTPGAETDKSFTQADIDRIVAERLAKAEKQFKTKLEKEKSEAERLAAMSAEERAKAEFEREREEFLAEKKALEVQKLELQTRKELSTAGLNENFAPFILNSTQENTADKVKEMISSFKELYEADLSRKVDERLAKPTPKGGQPKTPLDISKMTPAEINANWETISKM